MKLYQLMVPKDDATKVLNRFGSLGKVQFLDLNAETSPLLLPYTNMIRNIEESERKLIYLIEQYEKYNVKLSQPGNIERFDELLDQMSQTKQKTIEMLNDEIQNDIS